MKISPSIHYYILIFALYYDLRIHPDVSQMNFTTFKQEKDAKTTEKIQPLVMERTGISNLYVPYFVSKKQVEDPAFTI